VRHKGDVDDPEGPVEPRERELLPEPFWSVDSASLQGQSRSIAWYRGQMLMLVLAALAGIGGVSKGPPELAPGPLRAAVRGGPG